MKAAPLKSALLEIGVEEIPARFMPPALDQLAALAKQAFEEAGLTVEALETWGTPRRLTLFLKNVAPRSRDRVDESVGPPPKAAKDASGAWTQAAIGFAKKEKVDVSKLILKSTPKGERYVATHEVKGQKAEAVLKDMFPKLVQSLTFPKSMIWESNGFRFARPIRWFVSLYNGNVVRFTLNGIKSDRSTVGLLALGGQKISISKPEKYLSVLQGRCILVDQNERRKNIRHQIETITKKLKASALVSDEHLEEVVFLTEYPSSILGHFPESYLKLPREVLITVLKKHQKFFPIESGDGQLTNHFIGVRNGPSESQDDVRDGYERVINARFSDAQFFFEKDSQTPLASMVEKLKGVGFHEKLGSMWDKTERVRKLVAAMGGELHMSADLLAKADRAATLAKADLVTQMVGELPELQGMAGRFYAMTQESADVAHAIEQHYWPVTAESSLPESDISAVVALADKMDTLSANFSVGLIPSGSADPYGLRRAAVGVIRILQDKKWNLTVTQLIQQAFHVLGTQQGEKELKEFFNQRFSGWFSSQGFRTDEIDAVLSFNGASVTVLGEKLQGLKAVRGRPEFDSLANAIKRARNILTQAKDRGFLPDSSDLNDSELIGETEKNLHAAIGSISPQFYMSLEKRDYQAALLALASLKPHIDAFFEGVMVMVDDQAVRATRLKVLMQVKQLFDALADFSKLQGSAAVSG